MTPEQVPAFVAEINAYYPSGGPSGIGFGEWYRLNVVGKPAVERVWANTLRSVEPHDAKHALVTMYEGDKQPRHFGDILRLLGNILCSSSAKKLYGHCSLCLTTGFVEIAMPNLAPNRDMPFRRGSVACDCSLGRTISERRKTRMYKRGTDYLYHELAETWLNERYADDPEFRERSDLFREMFEKHGRIPVAGAVKDAA